MGKISLLKKIIIIMSSPPTELSCWYLCEDWVENGTPRSITANLRSFLNKRKEQKLDWEQRLKSTSSINAPSPPSCVPLYPQLPVPSLPEDLLGPQALGQNPPSQKPAPTPQQILRAPQTLPSSPEKSLQCPATCFNFPFPMRFTAGTRA